MTMETGPMLAPAGRLLRLRAWFGRVWRAFLGLFRIPEPDPIPIMPISPPAPPPPPPPPGRLRGRRRLQRPLVVPASGYIFTFQVHATLVWVSENLPPELLNSAIDELMPYVTRRLKAVAAQHSRQHPPHRAREFETALQQELTTTAPWTHTWGEATLTCRPHIWVELEEQVKQAVRPYWEELIKLDCAHDVQMRRAEYAEELSRHWTTVLTGLLDSPVAGGAADMTETQLAEVVAKIVAEQRAAAEKLEDLMTKKVDAGDSFERSEHFEALRVRLERRADRLFDRPAAATANGREPQA
jgi:hypothetical protein